MANPATRQQFIDTCKRKLGWPTVKINLADEAIDDRVDEALKFYYDYHFDGTTKVYYKITIDNTIKTNKYVTMPENIIGVVDLFDVNTVHSSTDLFNIKYQVFLSELITLNNFELAPFYYRMTHLETIQQVLNGKQPLRYNKNGNRLYLDMNWENVSAGDYLVAVAYEVMDPATYTDVWKDKWLISFCTALIKENWGEALSKYNVPLVGGIMMNGQQIKMEAKAEVAALKEELYRNYTSPIPFIVG